MATPFVTALIDTYNHELFIEDAIQSVLQQDFPASEMEILVVDDGSTDRTAEIVERFAPRARLLCKTNGGQASAFNAAIPEANGQVVAFLDGDDWWAPGKLKAVTDVFRREPTVGLVGHGVTIVDLNGGQRTEAPYELYRFRINSSENAKRFLLSRGFLGTSRMTCRKEVLRRVGHVPETLKFEADEYLFTLGGIISDVLILPDLLTFYRLHEKNLFQITKETAEGTRKKQEVLAALAKALGEQLNVHELPKEVANQIVECVQLEADLLRLGLDSGFPWETIDAERKVMRIFHNDASFWQHVFSYARLIPALVMPAAAYYRWRRQVSGLKRYKDFRERFFPFPVPEHVERREKPAAR